jgi:M6 family metalloprotease-like protein
MTSDAFKKASNYIVNIEQYDKNNDSLIDRSELSIIFIVAGDEQSTGTEQKSVWAHSTEIRYTPYERFILNTKTIAARYGLFGEYHNNHRNPATIGIIVHEMSHAIFAAPDLYDTKNGGLGIGVYGLMALGMWNSTSGVAGNSPKELSAYFKYKNNWADVKVINKSGEVTVNSSDTNKEEIIKIPVTDKEYFLIENISNAGYDKGMGYYVGGHKGGLAIWHIDENIIDANITQNQVNTNVSHKGIDIEEASTDNMDNKKLPTKEDLYFQGNNTSFGNNTSPNNNVLYNGVVSGFEITNISDVSNTMSFDIIKE